MKFTSLTTRRLVLGLLGAALLIAIRFLLLRSGP